MLPIFGAVASALPMILGAVQAGQAAKQNKNRPIYDAPLAAKEALENQKRISSMDKAPGTDMLLNQIRQSGAGATQTVKELSGGSPNSAAAVSDLYAKELGALQGIQGNQEAFKINQAAGLTNALDKYASYQDKGFEYNQNQPYQASVAAKSALTNASMSNILGGAMGSLGTIDQGLQNKEMMKMYQKMLSNGGSVNTTSPSTMIDLGSSTATSPGILQFPQIPSFMGYQQPTNQSGYPFGADINPYIPID